LTLPLLFDIRRLGHFHSRIVKNALWSEWESAAETRDIFKDSVLRLDDVPKNEDAEGTMSAPAEEGPAEFYLGNFLDWRASPVSS